MCCGFSRRAGSAALRRRRRRPTSSTSALSYFSVLFVGPRGQLETSSRTLRVDGPLSVRVDVVRRWAEALRVLHPLYSRNTVLGEDEAGHAVTAAQELVEAAVDERLDTANMVDAVGSDVARVRVQPAPAPENALASAVAPPPPPSPSVGAAFVLADYLLVARSRPTCVCGMNQFLSSH